MLSLYLLVQEAVFDERECCFDGALSLSSSDIMATNFGYRLQ